MLSVDDPFGPHLNEILGLKYDAQDFYVDPEREEPSPQCPLTFYDRHIGSNLLLQKVQVSSSLPNVLSTVCDEAIRTFLDHGYKFTVANYVGPGWRDLPQLRDSTTICECYINKIGEILPQLPSRLFILPDDPRWHCIFVCQDNDNYHPQANPFSTEAAFKINRLENFPDVLKIKDEDSESEYKPIILKLQDWARRYPNIAIWEFYAISQTAKKLLDGMRGTVRFKWDMSQTKGHANTRPSLERPLDANNGISSQLMSSKHVEHATRSKTRTNGQTRVDPTSSRTVLRDVGHDPVFVPRRFLPPKSYNAKSAHFIQHAWCRAVQNDATFIVFNSGDFERIGIRDRKTQTLYLSDLIESVNCKDPTYGKMHLGLYIAIVQDLMAREEQKVACSQVEELVGKKRVRGDRAEKDDQIVNPKRQRLRDGGLSSPGYSKREATRIDVEKHISARQLALISLDYGPYHSPSPSSFFRLGSSCAPGLLDPSFNPAKRKSKYSASEYFSLILKEPIGEGATGMVHRATAVIAKAPGSDSEIQMNLLVKLGRYDQRERLRGEFAVYQHMASASERVGGIVTVHGLFEDGQTGILALLMDDGGTTLMQREQARTGLTMVQQVQVSDEEREATMCVLRGIHKSGVRHRDIRPQNILIDSDLKISIIDFDCADLNPSPEKFEHETKRMENLLNGRHVKLGNLPL